MFRPKAADNPVGKHNFGGKLTAIALGAGGVIGSDVVVVNREVVLPEGAGRTTWSFRVTGVLGFLVAKVVALVGRVKTKDAHDIVWIIENWPEQQALLTCTNDSRRRAESNRCNRLCRPVPKPLGHAAGG
jgi:hypothetical protein